MKVENLTVSSKVMHHGLTVLDFLEEATQRRVPGLPFADEQGRIIGRISVRDVYKSVAVPDNLINFAGAIGDLTDQLDLTDEQISKLMASPVEDFLLEKMPKVTPHSSAVKALAIMEAHNSNYVFCFDESEYKGIVTRLDLTRKMLKCFKKSRKKQG